MTESPWRAHANKVIAQVVAANPGLAEPELRKKLSAAYPFRMREYHPYKIWLSAVKEHFEGPKPRKVRVHVEPVHESQLGLLEEA